MINELDETEVIQARVDELLVLEAKAQQRTEQLIELTQFIQEKNQQSLTQLMGDMNTIQTSLVAIQQAAASLKAYVTWCMQHASRVFQLLISSVVIVLLVIGLTLNWAYEVRSGVVVAEKKMAQRAMVPMPEDRDGVYNRN